MDSRTTKTLLGHYPLRKMCHLGNYFVILNEIPRLMIIIRDQSDQGMSDYDKVIGSKYSIH